MLIYESQSQESVEFQGNNEESSNLQVFFDKLVYRAEYRLSAWIESEHLNSISSVEMVWKAGDTAIAWISIVLKVVFSLAAFGVSIAYLRLLKSCPFSGWAVEQKLTIILAVLDLLSNFPIAGIYTSHFSIFQECGFAVIRCGLKPFVTFYVMTIMLESICRPNRKRTSLSVLLMGSCVILWVLDAWLAVSLVLDTFETNLLVNGHRKRSYHSMCAIVQDVMVLLSIVTTAFIFDETELFRFVVSVMQWLLLICVQWGVRLKVPGGLAADILELTADDIFVLLSAYFHWPYIYVNDAVYEDPKLQEIREVVAVEGISDGEVSRATESHDPT
jgi:hypothetical protein